MTRLSMATLPHPLAYDREAATIGIVHFGPGAFFRAHQAAYVDELLASDPRWAICAVALKTPGVRDALGPQDGLYTLVELGETTRFRTIGAIRELLVASEDGTHVLRGGDAAPAAEAEALGRRLADALLARGAASVAALRV